MSATVPTPTETSAGSDRPRRRVRRRLLLGSTAGAAVAGAATLTGARADAAPPTDTWKLGGNSGVTGANYLGTNNAAPLIFKTKPTSGTPKEAMRITPTQRVGIGTTAPKAQMHVKGAANITVRAVNTAKSGSSVGVEGQADVIGVRGLGVNYGIWGEGAYGARLLGSSGGVGAYGSAESGYGVYGDGAYGVVGVGELGVLGSGTVGVTGSGTSFGGDFDGYHGVEAIGTEAGVFAQSPYVGVWGITKAKSGDSFAIYGNSGGSTGSATWAGFFDGPTHVNGTLSKTAGSFKIDHPLDPENKYLSHSFVESPDMMNVYNGNVRLGADGTATVPLPAYFSALNRDFRYQLTAIGAAAPNLHVASTIKKNRFRIAGGPPHAEVSWQVTGIRRDSYAEEHPIVVETEKPDAHKGTLMFVPKGSRAKPMPRPRLNADGAAPAPEPPPLPKL